MLHNAYLLAKIGADIAENERNCAKNLPKIHQKLANFWQIGKCPLRRPAPGGEQRGPLPERLAAAALPRAAGDSGGGAGGQERSHAKNLQILQFLFLQFLAGSFSAVSKRNFARKYALKLAASFKIYKMCTLLHHSELKFLGKLSKISRNNIYQKKFEFFENLQNFVKFSLKSRNF